MNGVISNSENREPDFDSELLPDLSEVPLRALRHNAALRQALRHALVQSDLPAKTQTSCSTVAGLD